MVIAVIEHTSHFFVIVITVIKTTSYKVAAEQHQPFRAGHCNQHCSSACGSSVEPGAADVAPIVFIVIKLTSRIVAAEQDQCFGSGKAEQHCSSRAAQVLSQEAQTLLSLSSVLPSYYSTHNLPAEQDQPVSAGKSDQHCSSACGSGVEPG